MSNVGKQTEFFQRKVFELVALYEERKIKSFHK